VRMLQPRRELNLPAKALDADLRRELWRKYFHHDFTPQRRVLGDEDARHTAATELAIEPKVRAECRLQAMMKPVGHRV
jgi:hypothetical protein